MSDEVIADLAQAGVPAEAIQLRMIRSSGPGGQHVNKVSTAIQLSCTLDACGLDTDSLQRLARLAGRRLNNEGVLIITAQRLRTVEANKRDALTRLLELVAQARIAPKKRRATKPTKASKVRRLEQKQRRSQHKQQRSRVRGED